MAWRVQHFHISAIHDGNTLSHGHGLNLVMSDINHGRTVHLVDLDQFFSRTQAELCIQVGKRFIQKKVVRAFYDGAGQGNTLALSTGKILRLAVLQTFQLQHFQYFLQAAVNLSRFHFVGFQTVDDVIFYSHMREKGVVLEYHGYAAVSAGNIVDYLASYMQGAGGDILQTGDHAQGGGFSAAGRAQQNQPLPFPDFHIQIIDDHIFSVCFYDVFKNDIIHKSS